MSTQKIPSASELLQYFNEPEKRTLIIHENIHYFINEAMQKFNIGYSEAEPIVRQMIKIAQGEYTPEIASQDVLTTITTAAGEPTIELPVTKNELMLLGICVREYREQLRRTIEKTDGKKHWQVALIDQCNLLEQKLLSNEISYDTIHGKGGV